MDNPYSAPQHSQDPHPDPEIGTPSRTQDMALVRTWLGQSGFLILGLSGLAGVLGSLLLDLQAYFMPTAGSSLLGLLNTALIVVVSVVCIQVAVGRWRDPKAPLGPIINRGLQTGGRAIVPVILRGMAMLLGLLFFIVPGVIFALRTMMLHGMFALGYHDEGARSLKLSWDRSEGQLMDLFVLGLLGAIPLALMVLLEGLWQYVAYEESVGIGVLLLFSLPLAFVRAFVSMLLPLLGAARVVGWIKQDRGELSFPWEQ